MYPWEWVTHKRYLGQRCTTLTRPNGRVSSRKPRAELVAPGYCTFVSFNHRTHFELKLKLIFPVSNVRMLDYLVCSDSKRIYTSQHSDILASPM